MGQAGNTHAANGTEGGAQFWMGKETLRIPMTLYRDNRAKLVHCTRQAVAEDPSLASAGPHVILLQGGKTQNRFCTDVETVLRQESYFSYLFGVTEPDFYGALDVGSGKAVLYIPRLPESYAVWCGPPMTPPQFQAKYGVDEVVYEDEMEQHLAGIGGDQDRPTLLLLQGPNTDSGSTTQPASFKGVDKFVLNFSLLHPLLSECRVVKSEAELRVMRYAAAVSSEAHVQVMRSAVPGMMEYELEALFLHHIYAKGGCRFSAYTCICACGPNSAVLHYGHAGAPNDHRVEDGALALLDMGAEYNCYGADITCTFPINGKFTEQQKIVYRAVLAAQRSVFGAMKPGVSWVDMHMLAERTILEHLREAGVVQGEISELLEKRVAAVFMPHGLGHFLGLDVHDVGGYNADASKRSTLPGLKSLRTTRTLKEGMVLTVEPGCYFIESLISKALADPVLAPCLVPSNLDAFRGTGGVRLEDDVVVTATGIENLTKCPREIEEVEAVMAGGPWYSALHSLQSE